MMRAAKTPKVYPPGFFTALMRAENWPPRFEPRLGVVPDYEIQRRQAATAGRERAKESGLGWGAGTIAMPGTRYMPEPGWIGERK
jgi:hypothetical protein